MLFKWWNDAPVARNDPALGVTNLHWIKKKNSNQHVVLNLLENEMKTTQN